MLSAIILVLTNAGWTSITCIVNISLFYILPKDSLPPSYHELKLVQSDQNLERIEQTEEVRNI